MQHILLACILAFLIAFSSGCQSKDQPTANSNNSNISDVNTNPPNSAALPSPAGSQQDMSQPGAAPPGDATSTGISPTDSLASNLPMMAMDFHSSLLGADKARLEPLLADEYKRTRSDGTVVNKTQELASLKKVDDMFSMEAQPAKISGNTATVSGTISLTSRDMSGQKKGSWQTTDTFKKSKGKWVVVSSVEKKN